MLPGHPVLLRAQLEQQEAKGDFVSFGSFPATSEGQIFILIMSALLLFINEIFYQIIVNTVMFYCNVLTDKIEGILRMMPKLFNVGGEHGV